MEIDRINEELDIDIPEGDYETMAGYITSQLGRIPAKGETFTIGNFNITIIRSHRTRIDLIKLTVEPDPPEDM